MHLAAFGPWKEWAAACQKLRCIRIRRFSGREVAPLPTRRVLGHPFGSVFPVPKRKAGREGKKIAIPQQDSRRLPAEGLRTGARKASDGAASWDALRVSAEETGTGAGASATTPPATGSCEGRPLGNKFPADGRLWLTPLPSNLGSIPPVPWLTAPRFGSRWQID